MTTGQQNRASPLPHSNNQTSPKNTPTIKAAKRKKATDLVAQFTAPNYPTSPRTRGRPLNPPTFEIREAKNGYGVFLLLPKEKLRYCCFLSPTGLSEIAGNDFNGFAHWVVSRLDERVQNEKNTANIRALREIVCHLIEEYSGNAAAAQACKSSV